MNSYPTSLYFRAFAPLNLSSSTVETKGIANKRHFNYTTTPPRYPAITACTPTRKSFTPRHPIQMAPLTPHWSQPSHPTIQKVIIPSDPNDFTTKSISLVNLPPYALYAKLSFPPCTEAEKPTYATVQKGRDEHMNLNSDLVYINHSCEPSVVSPTFPPAISPPNAFSAKHSTD